MSSALDVGIALLSFAASTCRPASLLLLESVLDIWTHFRLFDHQPHNQWPTNTAWASGVDRLYEYRCARCTMMPIVLSPASTHRDSANDVQLRRLMRRRLSPTPRWVCHSSWSLSGRAFSSQMPSLGRIRYHPDRQLQKLRGLGFHW